MTREQLEHLIRATSVITDDDAIVVIGSQAILGQFPNAPQSLRLSMEADVFPLNHPERTDLIEGSIGELSPFHETFGYYAHGVAEQTAYLPLGWKERLIVVQNANTRGAKGLCLEIHDLLVAKTLAGREKDLSFLSEAAVHQMADPKILLHRLDTVEVDDAMKRAAGAAIQRVFGREGAERG